MEKTYGFGVVLKAIKKGKKAKRINWNGKDQYIELGSYVSYKRADDSIINANHETMGNAVIVFHGTSGIQVGWLASQADMLSDDWVIFD